MIVWILPGWEEAHPRELLRKYGMDHTALLPDADSSIRAAWERFKEKKEPLSVELPKGTDYKIEFSKPEVYSPTFLEWTGMVKKTPFDVLLATNECPIHGDPEMVARFYEMDDPEWRYYENALIKERIVRPLIDGLRGKDDSRESRVKLWSLEFLFYTGMRFQQAGRLTVKDFKDGYHHGGVKA